MADGSSGEGRPLRLEWRSPAELAENPRNWRRHPQAQMDAIQGVLAEVGWAGACLLNERTGRLIDGHARRNAALAQGCEAVPVLVGSWSEEDEAKILATLDPLAAMAEADGEALAALLAGVQAEDAAVRAMLDGLAAEALAGPEGGETPEPASAPGEAERPEGRYEEQYGVIVVCDSESHQEEVYARLAGLGLTCRVVTT